jgi:hypothetical protein
MSNLVPRSATAGLELTRLLSLVPGEVNPPADYAEDKANRKHDNEIAGVHADDLTQKLH